DRPARPPVVRRPASVAAAGEVRQPLRVGAGAASVVRATRAGAARGVGRHATRRAGRARGAGGARGQNGNRRSRLTDDASLTHSRDRGHELRARRRRGPGAEHRRLHGRPHPPRAHSARRNACVARASRGRSPRGRSTQVTRNPARALGWSEVCSLERGKHAEVLLLRRPQHTPTGGMPASPYRSLIDATQRDVRLVLLDGAPLAGDRDALRAAGARDVQPVRSPRGHFAKGIVLSGISLGASETRLRRALQALHTTLTPLFTADDHFFLNPLAGRRDSAPPYSLYDAKFNFIGRSGDPFALVAARWYGR